LLQAWGYKDALVETYAEQPKVQRPVWEADNSQLSRRDLFRLTSRQGQTGLARTLAQDDEITTGRVPPRPRQRLLRALAHLPAGNAPGGHAFSIRGFATLTVTEQCTACGACARACPTGALQLVESETSFQLTFTPQACTGCELCAHVCLPNALTVNRNPQLAEVFGQAQPATLLAGELKQCASCHARFASQSGDTLCPICQVRQANPFGSHLVPGMKKVRR
jgi:ferredoxin